MRELLNKRVRENCHLCMLLVFIYVQLYICQSVWVCMHRWHSWEVLHTGWVEGRWGYLPAGRERGVEGECVRGESV